MSEVGAAMNGAGDAVTFVRRSLQRIGRAYGLRNVEVFVVPTLLLVRYGDDQSSFVDLSSKIPTSLRLDQTGALYELLGQAQEARVRPAEGIVQLRRILASSTRFGAPARIVGVALIAGGIALTLEPSIEELFLVLGLSILVGAVSLGGERWPQLWPLLPPLAGLIAGTVTFVALDQGFNGRALHILIPPLAIFLPGAALTVSMIELSNGDIVAGGSRLAFGVIRLFLLVFGVLIAAQWINPVGDLSAPDVAELGSYVSVIGLVVFTAGVYVYASAPSRSFAWLLLVVLAAWAGQQVGEPIFGAYSGGFLGGATMIVAARLIQFYPGTPPLIVSFTPAFWLLVPGAIGLEGLSQVLQDAPQSGIDDLFAMLVTMVAIALGVLFGLIATGSDRTLEPE
jgi:uncharacterized membrane protein YjjP (DUF1212 family)/uncharacterized membrane protein YjjB (DUF3815 family)